MLSSNVPIDAHLGINSSVTSSYQAFGLPGNIFFYFLEPLWLVLWHTSVCLI
jgi:hypothetical protein